MNDVVHAKNGAKGEHLEYYSLVLSMKLLVIALTVSKCLSATASLTCIGFYVSIFATKLSPYFKYDYYFISYYSILHHNQRGSLVSYFEGLQQKHQPFT